MKKIISILVLLTPLLFVDAQFYTKRDFLQNSIKNINLQEVIISDKSWVKYPAYNNRKGWKKLFSEDYGKIIQEGEKYLNYQWNLIKATDFLEYERSGSRVIMEEPLFENKKALYHLTLAELAEGKGRFIDQLINGVFFHCEMSTWVLSAHVHSLSKRHRPLPDIKNQEIDLNSSDTGAMLSWIYFFFKDEFDKVDTIIAKRLKDEIKYRILDLYVKEGKNWWWTGEHLDENNKYSVVNNWTPWVNFNILQCFLLLEDDKNRLLDVVERTMKSVDKFINSNASDGACNEGPTYWRIAGGMMYEYLHLLLECTNGKINIFDEKLIKDMGEYIVYASIGDGWVVNFADSPARIFPEISLIYRYGTSVKSDLMLNYAFSEYKKNKDNFIPSYEEGIRYSFIHTFESFKQKKSLDNIDNYKEIEKCKWYDKTQFGFLSNDAGFYLGFKAGYNEESHNHNDVGTFVLYKNNKPIFVDVGVGEYTRQTFDNSVRYKIWTMRSDYHNLPIINGVVQRNGYKYKAENVSFSEKRKEFSADISKSYPKEAQVESWVRSYTLKKDKLYIKDKYSLKTKNSCNQIIFMTPGIVKKEKDGYVSVTYLGEKILLHYNSKSFDIDVETKDLTYSKRLSKVWGNSMYRIKLTAKHPELNGEYKFVVE